MEPIEAPSKSVGDNIPFSHDWSVQLAKYGDVVISESHWSIDVGSMVIGADGRASTINGTVTTCYISGGTADEYCVLNNSVLLNRVSNPDSGNKLVQRFIIHIVDGDYEPGTPPVVVLPDGLPDIPTLEAFQGATPGVSIWVDTTSAYPNGTLYYAVPPSNPATVDELTIVQGQGVKWIEVHAFNGTGSGVPLSRTLTTISPLTIAGGSSADLSANRTIALSVGAANTVLGSNGSNDSWMANPIVTTIQGTTAVYAGGSSYATLTASYLGFAPGDAKIYTLGSLTWNYGSTPIAQLNFDGTDVTFGRPNTNASSAGAFVLSGATTAGTGGDITLISGSGDDGPGTVHIGLGGADDTITVSTAGVSVNGYQIHDVVDPTSPQDAATKAYVDALATGLQIKGSVAALSNSNIASLSGLSTTVDSVALNVDGMRVLLTAETSAVDNGIYVVHSGTWTRSSDMAAGSHASGSFIFVNTPPSGTNTYGNTGWACNTAAGSDVVGTNSLSFTEFSAAGEIAAGAGLTKTGSTLSIVAADSTITVNSASIQVGQITNANVATGAGIIWSKLAGYPTLTCTAPLTIGGGSSADLSTNRTLAIKPATTSTAGSMSAADKTKIDGIPDPSLLNGYLLTPDDTEDVWDLVMPASIGITTGLGTINVLPKWATSSTWGSSSISDDGTKITLGEPLILHESDLAAAPGAGTDLIQAYSSQIVARAVGGWVDYAVTPLNLAASSSKAPKINKICDGFSVTAPTSTSFGIGTDVFGQDMPANRQFYATLILTQKLNSVSTSGMAGQYLITGNTDESGNVQSGTVFITQLGVVGQGAGYPIVLVTASGGPWFTLTINNASFTGALTGMWTMELGWAGT